MILATTITYVVTCCLFVDRQVETPISRTDYHEYAGSRTSGRTGSQTPFGGHCIQAGVYYFLNTNGKPRAQLDVAAACCNLTVPAFPRVSHYVM